MASEVRTIALAWSDFEINAMLLANRDEQRIARVGFYSGALAMLEMLGRIPPGEADEAVRALKRELMDFHAEIRKGLPR